LKTSQAGILLIQTNEGLTLVPKGDFGNQEVGYGHDLLPGDTLPSPFTEAAALSLLMEDISKWETALNKYNLKLTQPQFDALIDFTHNSGIGALHQLLAHGINQVPVQLLRWDHAGGKVLESLDERREAEIKMFTLAE
jgi:GH24 family phage-related lysozyme (muramidase)